MNQRLSRAIVLLCTVIALTQASAGAQKPATARALPPPREVFDVFEQSILEIQAEQVAGRVSSKGPVDAYLARVAAL